MSIAGLLFLGLQFSYFNAAKIIIFFVNSSFIMIFFEFYHKKVFV